MYAGGLPNGSWTEEYPVGWFICSWLGVKELDRSVAVLIDTLEFVARAGSMEALTRGDGAGDDAGLSRQMTWGLEGPDEPGDIPTPLLATPLVVDEPEIHII